MENRQNEIEEVEMKKLVVRVDERLLKDFQHYCKKQDVTASQMIRAYMRRFVVENYRRDQETSGR
ncbi:hypothetical protein [Acinetobacter sp. ANC 4639]